MIFKLDWHQWLNGHEFEQTLWDSEGQGSLACCSPWVRKEPDTTEWVNNNLIKYNRWKKWLKIYMPKCQQHIFLMGVIIIYLFPYHGGSDSKESACNVGDLGSVPRSGRFPGEGNSNLLQYSCLENSMDRRAWRGYSPRGLKESDTTETINTFTFHYFLLFS